KFDTHHDCCDAPQLLPNGGARKFNRIASFFVFLESVCEGETWFPYIELASEGETGNWRRHQDGGIEFKPVAGNALFWVNVHANGTGDERVVHAGLPATKGSKSAINIWTRKFY
ncbi:hypothetical protein BJ878DRAFT_421499, partial [Calycina marina]